MIMHFRPFSRCYARLTFEYLEFTTGLRLERYQKVLEPFEKSKLMIVAQVNLLQ